MKKNLLQMKNIVYGNQRVTPPMPPHPPGNKALLRDY